MIKFYCQSDWTARCNFLSFHLSLDTIGPYLPADLETYAGSAKENKQINLALSTPHVQQEHRQKKWMVGFIRGLTAI